MKTSFKKILKYSLFTIIFCFTLLAVFISNPIFLYANKTEYKNFTIYHNQPLTTNLAESFVIDLKTLKNSEIYDKNIKIDICLNDGSTYPKFIETFMGADVIRSFANKTVFHSVINTSSTEFMTKKEWNENFKVSQWVTHSFVHCLQFKKLGLFGSNPIAKIPEWKWEGYAECFSIQTNQDLKSLITLQLISEKNRFNWVKIDDFKTTSDHIKYLVLMKYCIEIKKMKFKEIIRSKNSENATYCEMLNWYKQK